MGPGGEVAASRLLAAGKNVAVIERELIGGECAYWACIPSKTLLRGPEAVVQANRAPGAGGARLDWPALRDYRDYMIRGLDDTGQVEGYVTLGASVIKAAATITGPGTVEAGSRTLTAEHIIVATGSQSVRPDIDGLDRVPVWTNREATTVADIPSRVLMLGGSAVGVELGQFYARAGADVQIVQRGATLIDREEPRVGELAQAALEADGVTAHTGHTATCAVRDGETTRVTLDDGTSIDVVVLGTGRRPHTTGLGADAAGARLDDRGAIVVDEHCRAADGLWALGDVTGVALFTHIAKYQARIVADAILGRPRPAHYDGIPRVVFADPEIAAVGLTTAQARDAGLTVATAEIDLAENLARPWTFERDPRRRLGLIADTTAGVLVGAWAVAPLAGEWIHQAALAIRPASRSTSLPIRSRSSRPTPRLPHRPGAAAQPLTPTTARRTSTARVSALARTSTAACLIRRPGLHSRGRLNHYLSTAVPGRGHRGPADVVKPVSAAARSSTPPT
jgi:pyruvate/2-oxoglutarate dehydrogenase complex dihydrolipoamide dehydrogenase (E3) component